MKLEKTLKVLRRLSSVLDSGPGINDALLVGDIELVLRVLKTEIRSLPDDELEPRLLIALSKLLQAIGDEDQALTIFQKAATFADQNRGYYSDLGYCYVQLLKESKSEELRLGVRSAVEKLQEVCPFPEDLQRAFG
jgi:tetratricopeptide (TPR) repeat protein